MNAEQQGLKPEPPKPAAPVPLPAEDPKPAEPSTAVARTDAEPELPPEIRAKVALRRMESRAVAAIKGASWGNDLSLSAKSAVATWAIRQDVEPVTEIDILGGNVYIKARHYERKLGELFALGVVTRWSRDWVQPDARLEKLAEDPENEQAKDECKRRLWERIAHGIPDEADCASVFSIWVRDPVTQLEVSTPAIGVKWHIPGKKKTIKPRGGGAPFQVDADPVGDQSPNETIETRSLRRAMLKIKAAFPPGFKMAGAQKDEDSIELAEVLKIETEQRKANEHTESTLGKKPLLNAGDAYGLEGFATTPGKEPVPVQADEELSDEQIAKQWDELERGGRGNV